MKVKSIILILFVVIRNINLSAQTVQELILSEQSQEIELSPYLQMLKVEGGITIDSLMQSDAKFAWQPYNENTILEAKPSRWWLKLSLHNQTQSTQTYFISTSRFDTVFFYSLDTSGHLIEQKAGIRYPNHQKTIPDGTFNTGKIFIKAGEAKSLYISITNHKPDGFQFISRSWSLYSEKLFEKLFISKRYFNLAFIGALLVMAIYNFFIFFTVREKNYLSYVAYNLSILTYCVILSGDAFEWFFKDATLLNHAVLVSGILGMSSYSYFSKLILQLKQVYPKSNRFVNFFIGLLLFSLLLTLLDLTFLSIPICFTVALVGYTWILILAIMRVREGYKPANYFLIANIFYYIGIVTSILQMLGILPTYVLGLTSSNFTEIGVLLELSFFSLSLGAQINLIKEELSQKQLEAERIKLEEEQKRNELIRKQNEELEQKVQERTLELQEKNEEIQQQNEELTSQAEALAYLNEQLKAKNEDILASIQYAKRIQEAIMPSLEEIQEVFPDSFVLFKPRDIISGDFYWFAKKEEMVYFAAGDCTGHGVPGALMSMAGVNFLNEIVENNPDSLPNQILSLLNKEVRKALKQDSTSNRDGMDISLCAINLQSQKFFFSGANNSAILVFSKDNYQILEADGLAIGGYQNQEHKEFTLHSLPLANLNGGTLYLFSDGFQDQFGGTKHRKFMAKTFRNLLIDTATSVPIHQQMEFLWNKHLEWKGSHEQTDDILIFGVKIKI